MNTQPNYDVALSTVASTREKCERQLENVRKLEQAIRLCKHFKLPLTGKVGLQFNGNPRDPQRATFTVRVNGKVHDTVPAMTLPRPLWTEDARRALASFLAREKTTEALRGRRGALRG